MACDCRCVWLGHIAGLAICAVYRARTLLIVPRTLRSDKRIIHTTPQTSLAAVIRRFVQYHVDSPM